MFPHVVVAIQHGVQWDLSTVTNAAFVPGECTPKIASNFSFLRALP